jgi:hypothetical protein
MSDDCIEHNTRLAAVFPPRVVRSDYDSVP